MSKQINRGLAFLILFCLCAVSLTTRSHAQAGATATAQNAAIISTTDAVLKETSELRELSILRAVKSGAQSRSDIERMIVKNLDTDTTPAEMHASEVFLRAFGLAPDNFQYRSFLIKLLTEQVAGYYDPKAQQFYLADWIELEGQKPVMAHELTHALQDQHFDLKRFEKWPKGDSDAELAAHALIEGDATLAMTLYMTRHPMVALAFMKSLGTQENSSEQFKQAPRALRESLLFPYEAGSNWATQVYRRGGWDLVSKAFTQLPQSSEQIIHPDKYFSHEAPVKVTLPDLKLLLGPTWKRIDTDVNGEWGLYLILDEYLNSSATSKEASAGWGGDRYALYEGANRSDVFIAQFTTWDTALDARDFFIAYLERTWKRYPDAKNTDTVSTTERGERHEWKTAGGRGVLELRGSRVLILEGIPAKANTTALLNRIWHQG
ncbi:MAG TPA: hypothetical protein VJP89_16480 [Pyrinomonadaceae bacterium]|nr:hypothetical protein [Pyrinomonadaceae bacterium]